MELKLGQLLRVIRGYSGEEEIPKNLSDISSDINLFKDIHYQISLDISHVQINKLNSVPENLIVNINMLQFLLYQPKSKQKVVFDNLELILRDPKKSITVLDEIIKDNIEEINEIENKCISESDNVDLRFFYSALEYMKERDLCGKPHDFPMKIIKSLKRQKRHKFGDCSPKQKIQLLKHLHNNENMYNNEFLTNKGFKGVYDILNAVEI